MAHLRYPSLCYLPYEMSGLVRDDHSEGLPPVAVNVRFGSSYLHANVLLNHGLNSRDSGGEVRSLIGEPRNDPRVYHRN